MQNNSLLHVSEMFKALLESKEVDRVLINKFIKLALYMHICEVRAKYNCPLNELTVNQELQHGWYFINAEECEILRKKEQQEQGR